MTDDDSTALLVALSARGGPNEMVRTDGRRTTAAVVRLQGEISSSRNDFTRQRIHRVGEGLRAILTALADVTTTSHPADSQVDHLAEMQFTAYNHCKCLPPFAFIRSAISQNELSRNGPPCNGPVITGNFVALAVPARTQAHRQENACYSIHVSNTLSADALGKQSHNQETRPRRNKGTLG